MLSPVIIKHRFRSTIPDIDSDSIVRPSNWNEDHVIEGFYCSLRNVEFVVEYDGVSTVSLTTKIRFVPGSTGFYFNGMRQCLGKNYIEEGANRITFNAKLQQSDTMILDIDTAEYTT